MDILVESQSYLRPPSRIDRDWFWEKAEIDLTRLCWEFGRRLNPVMKAKVTFLDNGNFEFSDALKDPGESVTAYIFFDLLAEAHEIFAWRPKDNRIASLGGRHFALGQQWVDDWDMEGKPLPVFREPLEWLAANRRGIVIVDQEAARWNLIGRKLGARSIEHGEALARSMALPAPSVLVARQSMGAVL